MDPIAYAGMMSRYNRWMNERLYACRATLSDAERKAELTRERRVTDQEIDDWVSVAHFFNHQTHHRGQLTTLLSQCGIDPGLTDLIGLPGLEQTGC